MHIKGAVAAIEFFKQAFGAEERVRYMTPAGNVGMAELQIGNSLVRVSDAVEVVPTQAATLLCVDNADAWWKRAGCEVVMPIADMFFGDRFGILRDAYGNRWAIAQHTRDVSEAEMKQHVAEMPKVR